MGLVEEEEITARASVHPGDQGEWIIVTSGSTVEAVKREVEKATKKLQKGNSKRPARIRAERRTSEAGSPFIIATATGGDVSAVVKELFEELDKI